MKLNRTNKKIISLLFAALMIIFVFAVFVTPVMAAAPVTVTPHVATLNVTEEITITTNRSVTWGVNITGIVDIISTNETFARFIARAPGVVNVTVNTTVSPHVTNNTTITVRPFPTAITVAPLTATLNVTENVTFTATVPGGADPRVIWTSLSPAIGTIHRINDTAANLTAVSAGTVIVRATSVVNASAMGHATVTVRPAPTGITVSPSTATLNITEIRRFNATVLPAGADQNVTWSVENHTGTGTIDTTGNFIAVSAGHVIIRATSVVNTSIRGSAVVTVRSAPTTITVAPPTATLNIGGTQLFNATVLPAEADSRVTWISLSPTVGTINATTGVFTAAAAGTVTVTATSVVNASAIGSATVTVRPAPTGITVTIPVFNVTDTKRFTAAVLPAGADQNVTWSVENHTGTGTINTTTGDFTAVSAGFVTITARSVAVPTITNTTIVTIIALPAPTAITVIPATATLNVTETRNFNATVPAGSDPRVTWSVVNATVGTIDVATGLFRANATGTTNITATSVVAPGIAGNATVTVRPPVIPLSNIDANRDGEINALDFGILAVSFMRSRGEPGFNDRADFNRDGDVNSLDFGLLAVNFGRRV